MVNTSEKADVTHAVVINYTFEELNLECTVREMHAGTEFIYFFPLNPKPTTLLS